MSNILDQLYVTIDRCCSLEAKTQMYEEVPKEFRLFKQITHTTTTIPLTRSASQFTNNFDFVKRILNLKYLLKLLFTITLATRKLDKITKRLPGNVKDGSEKVPYCVKRKTWFYTLFITNVVNSVIQQSSV